MMGTDTDLSTPLGRLHHELKELQERHGKLLSFMKNDNFLKLSNIQQSLMGVQLKQMEALETTLLERIKYWN